MRRPSELTQHEHRAIQMTNFPKVTRQIVLKSRPAGIPQAENFDFAEARIPELADGQILVRNEYLSVDPAMRGWVSAVANYSTPVGIGEVMRSFASGKVVASKHKDYAEGESVSGSISDAVMARLSIGARVVICGTASVASWDPPPLGPRVERHILVKRARVSGFIIFDYQHRYMEAVKRLAEWVRDGKLRYREEISDGIEHCPRAIAELYRGENLGKRLIRLQH
jgi:NADPH-dependent curcumin reductase CurA